MPEPENVGWMKMGATEETLGAVCLSAVAGDEF